MYWSRTLSGVLNMKPLDFFLLCKFVYFVVMVESVTEIQHHTGKS
jgi:hypothetical protein